jgi:hypothetical protein
MTTTVQMIIAVFCVIAAAVLYKVEVLDHPWTVYARDASGYVQGWNTPTEAIQRDPRCHHGAWDCDIVSQDAFRVRRHVNPVVGYLLPIGLLALAFITLLGRCFKDKSAGTC